MTQQNFFKWQRIVLDVPFMLLRSMDINVQWAKSVAMFVSC